MIRRADQAPVAEGPLDPSLAIDTPTVEVSRDIRRLRWNNRFSLRPVTSKKSSVVATMTTHGARVNQAYVAIESIARGSRRPNRFILWIDDPAIAQNLPAALRRLRRRGLEIIEVDPGLRVHTKYRYYVESSSAHRFDMVTCDDDIIYPSSWLLGLERARLRHPDAIVAYRAHRILTEGDAVAPYSTWPPNTSDVPSLLHFGTSVSGQLFPPAFLDLVRDAGRGFLEVSPTGDDVWLHFLAAESGVPVVQVTQQPVLFPFVPGSQADGLYRENGWNGGNDRQIAATYTAEVIERLRRAESSATRPEPTSTERSRHPETPGRDR
ncbi:hypothetical protein [Subtercola endophyticus]|uniref:hypothetical protein n=1 Tax=Subtercola endophyticus TaxID=2895559 RepID=UPI001E4AAF25|nr:hypothetical protein [Subtercola endophyticus]UFS59943.1 hypothetical protein LQ955_03930 [Subtercola endophyticus]